MTEPAPDQPGSAPMLPGLDGLRAREAERGATELERYALELVGELAKAGKLDAAGRLNSVLVVDLARACGISARAGKAAGAALAAARLMEAIDRLPALDDAAGVVDEWAQVVAALSPAEIIGVTD